MGSALALSIAGYFRLRPSSSPAKTGAQLNGIRARGLKDELRILSSEEELAKIINGTSITTRLIDEEEFLKIEEGSAKIVYFTSFSTMKNMINLLENEKLELEREIARLKNIVEALEEREKALEVQLLEHRALKDQEATLRELENGIKINNVKFKSAREDIKDLESGPEVEKKLARAKELGEEAFDLRRENSRLMDENSKLVHHLESMKMSAAPNLDDSEAEANSLREENEKLMKEIEQLRTDRCTDAEELVYLRWVNACMRYELRNHQHSLDFDTVSVSKSSKSRFLGKIRKLVSKDKAHGTPTISFTSSRRSFDSISSYSESSRRRFSSFS